MWSPVVALRVYYFVAFGTLGLYLPFFPSWLEARGFRGAYMSALVVVMPLCQLLSPSLVGLLSDKWGLRGRMMTFCGATTALGMSILAVGASLGAAVPFVLVWSCLMLFAALRGPSVGLADVLAMETTKNYGHIRLWGSLGFMCMALVGANFIDVSSPRALPLCIAAWLWLVVLVSCLLPRTSRLPPRPALADARALFRQKSYRELLLSMVLICSAASAYDLCATMHLTRLGASGAQIGGFWALGVLAEVGLMLFAGSLTSRVGPGKLLTVACAVGALRWFLMARSRSLGWLLLLQPLHAFSFGLMWLSAIAVLRREVGGRGTATAHGLFSSAIAVGNTLGLAVWGLLFERSGSAVVFTLAGVVASCATLSAARLIRLRTTLPSALTESQA